MRLAEAAEHANSLAIACLGLGRLYLNQGTLSPATAVLERGLTLCDTAHIALLRPAMVAALGYVYTLAGRNTEALPLLRQLQQTALLPTPLSSLVLTWVSEISLLNGRVEEAVGLARRALELAQQRQERGNQAWTLRLLGALAMHDEAANLAQAQDYYEQALTLAEALGMRPLLAHCHFALRDPCTPPGPESAGIRGIPYSRRAVAVFADDTLALTGRKRTGASLMMRSSRLVRSALRERLPHAKRVARRDSRHRCR